MVRALQVSPRVSVLLVTPMLRAPQVSHAAGVGVASGPDGEDVAGCVTVDAGVSDVDGGVGASRVWVRARAVVGLLLALLAGRPAGPGGVCLLLVLSVFGGPSPILAECAAADVVGGGGAGDAMVSLATMLEGCRRYNLGLG